MKTLVQRFQQLHNDEAGQGLIEYVMLIALVISLPQRLASLAWPPRSLMLSRRLARSWARTSPNRAVGRHGNSPNFVCSGSKGPAQTQPKPFLVLPVTGKPV